jgi:hypothetical protein
MVASSVVLGRSFVEARRPPGTIRVVGAATVPFTSDVVKWRVQLVRSVPAGSEADGFRTLRDDRVRLLDRLESAGVPTSEVSLQPVTTNPIYDREGRVSGAQLRQTVLVLSSDLAAVESLALDPGDLVRGGLGLEQSTLEYFFEGIGELKRSLLQQAAGDARARAVEIGGDRLGDLIEARAGVFQIREPYSTEVQGYGVYDTQTREKEITVTVHATFGVR